MRKLIVLSAIMAVAVWAGAGFAYENSNDIGYFAVELTNPDAITIDGNGDDWADFPTDYIIGADQMLSTVGRDMPSVEDWDAIVMVAWCPVDNMIYCFVRVMDDTLDHDVTDPDAGYNDDDLEFLTDCDNSGGAFPDRINAQQYTIHLATEGYAPAAYLRHQLPPEMQWGMQEPYCSAAVTVDPPGSGHLALNVTVTYEWKIAVYDDYRPGGPDASTRHILTADETFGMVVQFNEVDGSVGNQIGTCPTYMSSRDGSYMSSFTLLTADDAPWVVTSVEPTSWGAIKALLSR